MASSDELAHRRLTELEAALAKLLDEVDRKNTINAEKIGAIQAATQELQILIHGEPKYHLQGLALRIEQIEKDLAEFRREWQSLKDRLRGVQIGLGATVATGGATLIGVLVQLFGG